MPKYLVRYNAFVSKRVFHCIIVETEPDEVYELGDEMDLSSDEYAQACAGFDEMDFVVEIESTRVLEVLE